MALSVRTAKKIKKGIGDRIYSPEAEVEELKKRVKNLKPLPHSKPKLAPVPKIKYR